MKNTGQGALQQGKLLRLLVYLLLPIALGLSQNISASSADKKNERLDKAATKNHNIHLIYTHDSKLQSSIAQQITTYLKRHDGKAQVTHTSPTESNNTNHITPDLIVAIGLDSVKYSNANFINTDTLFIVSNPGKYQITKKSRQEKSLLYMTQSYCTQIRFIKEINRQWTTISYLYNDENLLDRKSIDRCAEQKGMSTYKIHTTRDSSLSADIKNALTNSDLILALPNKTIFNSRSVKNILLTSYRNRKPVIGFSKNFVNAGALAAIHSDAEQIADSANKVIDEYYQQNNIFKQKVHYPETFSIAINKQVFRALNIPIPNIEKITQVLSKKGLNKTSIPQ